MATPQTALPMTPEQLRVFQLFFPHAYDAYGKVISNGARFVQYTRAENVVAMLRSKSVWLRKTHTMNDYREITHGWELLEAAFKTSESGAKLRNNLDAAHPGIVGDITSNFDPWISNYLHNTYVACLSEHYVSEDQLGRLSMWRAYGGRAGVAMVVKSTPFLRSSHALGAYSSPVAYFDKPKVEAHLARIAQGIEVNFDFVKALPRLSIVNTIHEAFRYGMICCKHPGFEEEREWRIVYNPDRDILPIEKRPLARRIETIDGTPQSIYSMPLRKLDDGYDLEIESILDRIIVGPSDFPAAIIEALYEELEKAGVSDARKKVVFSDIPLRPSSLR